VNRKEDVLALDVRICQGNYDSREEEEAEQSWSRQSLKRLSCERREQNRSLSSCLESNKKSVSIYIASLRREMSRWRRESRSSPVVLSLMIVVDST
jgi:hypothetical protein